MTSYDLELWHVDLVIVCSKYDRNRTILGWVIHNLANLCPLHHAVTLTFDPLHLNFCSTSGIMCPNPVMYKIWVKLKNPRQSCWFSTFLQSNFSAGPKSPNVSQGCADWTSQFAHKILFGICPPLHFADQYFSRATLLLVLKITTATDKNMQNVETKVKPATFTTWYLLRNWINRSSVICTMQRQHCRLTQNTIYMILTQKCGPEKRLCVCKHSWENFQSQ